MRQRSPALPPPAAVVDADPVAPMAPISAPLAGGSLTAAAARLSFAQIVVFSGGLLTGPLLARALGASGRGHLASIVVPITLLGWLAGLGLGSWVAVQTARGRALGEILGTTGALSLGFSLVAAIGAVPLADLLADGNQTIFVFLLMGVALLPVSLFLQLLSCAAIGTSRWKMQARHRTVPAIFGVVLTSGLFVAGELTVASAAGVFLAGAILSVLPLLPLLAEAWPLRFRRSLARESLGFGVRAWAANLGALTNARLDQLLMIPLVPARELGLYAVAVTYSALPTVLSSAMVTVIVPRIAHGDRALVGRSLRVTLGLMLVAGISLALLALWVIPLAFGAEFDGAVRVAWILLLAGVPLAGTTVLTNAMTSLGRPGSPAIGQFIAGALTLVGLLILLPTMQAVGAAIVSLIAYSVALGFMIGATKRHLKTSVRALLIPQRNDLAWAVTILRSMRSRFVRPRSSPDDASGT